MLQFSATLYSVTARLTPRSSWRFTALIANNFSTAIISKQPTTLIKEDKSSKYSKIQQNVLQKKEQHKFDKIDSQTNINLSENTVNDKFTVTFLAAKSVDDLLDMAMLSNLSTSNALKLITEINSKINSEKSKAVNIEADQRFIHLKKIIRANNQIKLNTGTSFSDDLSQYTQLSTPAMITMIASLSEQGKRNTPLLRLLSYNIIKYNMKLNVKQCATLLYSMAVLNFLDKALLEKIMADLLQCIPKNINAVTNKSIITSLGFLHYKNEDVLDIFCDTLFNKSISYKLQDYSSILQTFAALQYKSQKVSAFIENFMQLMDPLSANLTEWLDIVWSLTVLGFVQQQHVESVLKPLFITMLNDSTKLNMSKKLKLLNINAFAQFALKDYKGPLLNKYSEEFKDISLIRAKGKQVYINALSETLKTLLPSPSHFKTDIDTNMGFLLDAEYRIDDQLNPISKENWNKQAKDVRRIGIMVHDYHDYCRGQDDLLGSIYLQTQLLKAQGYDLLTISYKNFSIQDKLVKRISYLKQCMKDVQENRST
ncbi:FAST kinase domain-containing protein 4 [Odontomachus brunneus]|uniref:FAST kinase domain-containing protein 4 n=1 Tax=Odontomachus brunneus TaxID=486640 RepID=UPI0013F197DC|nr:FAST kinase domain-containing protein 4 [Odontomachus brunneus]